MTTHIPVLLNEVVELLSPKAGQHIIDCTAGGGGHTLALAKLVGSEGKVLAIDWDEESLQNLKKKLAEEEQEIAKRIIVAHGNFVNLGELVYKYKFPRPAGVLFDLGFSSIQLTSSRTGFTFQPD